MNKKQKTGNRANYLAMAEAIKQGFNAFPTCRNSQGADFVITDDAGVKCMGVQVKGNLYQSFFLIGSKGLTAVDERYFYVLVDLRTTKGVERVRYFVIPSKIVAEKIAYELSKLKKTEHSGWDYVVFIKDILQFENTWNLITEKMKE